MCIIVDSNTIASVFNPLDSGHPQFRPVFEHINSGKSKMIIGGTKFHSEINLLRKYAKLLSEMRKTNRLVYESDTAVDELEKKIEKKFTDPLFNDKHIVALTYTANARLVCTKDKVLQSYLTKSEFYNRNKSKPKIYNERSRNTTLPTGSFRPKCRLC